jgi:DNA-binding NtrC family response regulator
MAAPREFRRVLVIEDDRALRTALVGLVRGWGGRALEAGNVAEALVLLSPPPDLIIADVSLPDGSVRRVLEEAARAWPHPTVIVVSGRASAREAFELAQMGVRTYLPKPVSLEEIAAAVDRVRAQPPLVEPLIAELVGRTGLRQANERVSSVMFRQALSIAGGSRSDAARLLEVSRQAVQQRLRAEGPRPASRDETDPKALPPIRP